MSRRWILLRLLELLESNDSVAHMSMDSMFTAEGQTPISEDIRGTPWQDAAPPLTLALLCVEALRRMAT